MFGRLAAGLAFGDSLARVLARETRFFEDDLLDLAMILSRFLCSQSCGCPFFKPPSTDTISWRSEVAEISDLNREPMKPSRATNG